MLSDGMGHVPKAVYEESSRVPEANQALEKLYGLAREAEGVSLFYASRNVEHNNAWP